METSIHVTDGMIRGVSGVDAGDRILVDAFCTLELPDGAVSEGEIVKDAELVSCIGELFSRGKLNAKTVRLIVDGTGEMVRSMDVPKLPDRKLMPILRTQLQDQLAGYTNPVIDYMTLGDIDGGKGIRVLCAAIERERLASYRDVFAKAGITLSGIDIAVSGAVRFMRRLPEPGAGTYIVSVVSTKTLTSMLFADGMFSIVDRSRLLEPRGTPGFAVEISRALSRLLQFNIAQRNNARVTDAYMCAMLPDEIGFCGDISQSLGINVGLLPRRPGIACRADGKESFSYGDYLYNLGDLCDDKKESQRVL